MNCETVEPLLIAYLDAELAEDENEFVQSHLADCDACAARLASYKNIGLAASEAFAEHRPSADFTDAVMAGIRRENEPVAPARITGLRAWLARPLPVAAGLLLTVGLAVALLTGNEPNDSEIHVQTPPAQGQVAQITTDNAVLIRTGAGAPWRAAKAQQSVALEQPTTVVTGPGSRAQLRGPDGWTLELEPLAAVVIGRQLKLEGGSARLTLESPKILARWQGGRLQLAAGRYRLSGAPQGSDRPAVLAVERGVATFERDGVRRTVRAGQQLEWRSFADSQLAMVLRETGATRAKPDDRVIKPSEFLLSGAPDPIASLLAHLEKRTFAVQAAQFLAAVPGLEPSEPIRNLYDDPKAAAAAREPAGFILAAAGEVDRFAPVLADLSATTRLRIQAARAIGAARSDQHTPALSQALADAGDSPKLYGEIARALYYSGDRAIVCRLLKTIEQGDEPDVLAAIAGLERIGRREFPLELARLARNRSRSYAIRSAATQAAWAIDPATVTAWLKPRALRPDGGDAVEALTILAALDPAEAAGLARILLDRTTDRPVAVRLRAAQIAARLDRALGTPILAEGLKDPDFLIRLTAAEALLARQTKGMKERALNQAVEALTTDNWYIQARAALLLSRYGDTSHIPKLIQVVQEPTANWTLKTAADDALIRLNAGSELVGLPERLTENQRALARFASLSIGGEFDPAVRRIVREAQARAGRRSLVGYTNELGIVRLMQLAVRGIDSPTRRDAAEALRKLSGRQFGFDPTAPVMEREQTIEAWEQWWLNNRKLFQETDKEKDS